MNIYGIVNADKALEIDTLLEDQEGIIESTTSIEKEQTAITYDPHIITNTRIIIIIRTLGFDVEVINN